MNSISVLRPDPSGKHDSSTGASPLRNALAQIFGGTIRPARPPSENASGREIVFVPPGSEKTWLLDLLLNLNAPSASVPCYAICRNGDDQRDNTYAGLVQELQQHGYAHDIDLGPAVSPLLDRLLKVFDPPAGSPPPRLRQVLDGAFPGGIEGLMEICFRPTGDLHDFVRYEGRSGWHKHGALSTAFGACVAGDISPDLFQWVLDDTSASVVSAEDGKKIREYLEGLHRHPDRDVIDTACRAPLGRYLRDRNIIVVEDELHKFGWDRVLSALCAPDAEPPEPLKRREKNQKIGGAVWSCYENIQSLMEEANLDGDVLGKCDILFLDLASSSGGHLDGIVSPMLRKGFVELASELKRLHRKRDPECGDEKEIPVTQSAGESQGERPPVYRESCPIVIAFTATQTGMTTRTLLREINVTDFFFKTAHGVMHQRMHYYTLRQAVISALEQRAAWISYSEPIKFRKWFLQFDQQYRPDLLRIMEQYHHYSATSLIRLCRRFLDNPNRGSSQGGGNEERWFSYLGRPNKSGPATLGLLAKALATPVEWNSSADRKKQKPSVLTYEDTIEKLRMVNDSGVGQDKSTDSRRSMTKLASITFVDDFIGSGGQLESYLPKFFRACDKALKPQASASSEDSKGNAALANTRFEAWYALGLNTPELRKVLGCEADIIEPGEWYEITVDLESKAPEKIWPERRASDERKVFVRIEDVIPQLDRTKNNLEMVLKSQVWVTHGRRYEVPCQFEPFAWKDGLGLVSTFTNVPGNTVPIIWGDHKRNWFALKERFFNPFDEGKLEETPPCYKDDAGGRCVLDPTVVSDRVPERDETQKYAAYRDACYAVLGCVKKRMREGSNLPT